MSATLDSYIFIEVGKREVKACRDCGHFSDKDGCALGYNTKPWRRPCKQAVHRKDMQEAKRRWSW